MNVSDPRHFVQRINFLSYRDIKLTNERLNESKNESFLVMVRRFRFTSLDMFLKTAPLRKNIIDQTFDELGFLNFRNPDLDKTHYLRVTGRILNIDDISSSGHFTNVLCLITRIEAYKGQGKRNVFTHTLHESALQLITVLAVKVTRTKAYRRPLLKDESYTFILDGSSWIMNYLPINNAP